MALPKLDTPTYSMTLPSTGEEIKYRPFLVKEQKLMLIAQDAKNVKETYNNLKGLLVEYFDIGFCVLGDLRNSED